MFDTIIKKGKLTNKYRIWLGTLLIIALVAIGLKNDFFSRLYYRLKRDGYIDKKVDLSEMVAGKSVMIALTMGQSNAANSGEHHYRPRHEILNYANGKLVVANDPLLGADGNGGSVWGVLGDMLIDSGLFKKVIIIPIGIGSTSISCWADSLCHDKLVTTLQDLQQHHIKLTHIFWHQGESDALTSKETYKIKLAKIVATIRTFKQDAPFYCSVASYHPNFVAKNITDAQIEFINENKNVLAGSYTDTITKRIDRFQGVHFTATGEQRYAHSWFLAIKQSRENR